MSILETRSGVKPPPLVAAKPTHTLRNALHAAALAALMVLPFVLDAYYLSLALPFMAYAIVLLGFNFLFGYGGLLSWLADGLPVSTEVPASAGGPVSLTLHDEPTATREYLQSRIGAADLAIWDARAPQEYSGEKVLAAKAGHIPGAINFEWTAGMDQARNLRIRKDMPQILEQLGITPDKEVITHCQTHHRSGFTYLVAKALGYPRVKGYAGSWGEWGNHPDTPVAI